MKTTIFSFVLFAILLSSCTTVYYTQSYEDANYLTQDEFADFTDYKVADDVKIEDENIVLTDTAEDGTIVNNYYGNYYEADDYYDGPSDDELKRIIIHGVLHLIGYNDIEEHEKKMMTKLENQYQSQLLQSLNHLQNNALPRLLHLLSLLLIF